MAYKEKFDAKLRELSHDKENYVNEWIYAGGSNFGRHLNWFRTCYPDKELPEHKTNCICTKEIAENCYISNKVDGRFVVVGNCCIKRYLPEDASCRTCLF